MNPSDSTVRNHATVESLLLIEPIKTRNNEFTTSITTQWHYYYQN